MKDLEILLPAITGDKTGDKIISYLQEHEYITTTIAKSLLGLETSRTREILKNLVNTGILKSEGANRNRKYKLK